MKDGSLPGRVAEETKLKLRSHFDSASWFQSKFFVCFSLGYHSC